METIGTSTATRYYVMAVTTTRLYSFTGTGALDVSIPFLCVSHPFLVHVSSTSYALLLGIAIIYLFNNQCFLYQQMPIE